MFGTAITAANTRLEVRISAELHAQLERAVELHGRTLTDFVVAAVQDAAQRAIEQAEVVRLSLADQECFAQALLSPPEPAPAPKLSRIDVIRPPGVGIYRPAEPVPKGISNDPVSGLILSRWRACNAERGWLFSGVPMQNQHGRSSALTLLRING